MEHPMRSSIELSKEEKLKQLNDRLNSMLKLKKVDPLKIEQSITKEVKSEQKKEDGNKEKQETTSKANEEQEGEGDVGPTKGKKIKKQEKKEGHVLRKAAGEVWEDKTMEDWPENDYRIFCGNLGNEVNDEILGSIFRRYSSFQMARVVRDRRTGKTRGYGFVSFTGPNDFLNALKEMNGKHVGNRPVKLMKSSWKDRDLNSAKNQYLPSDFKKNSQK
jgi:RNA recognition motif-containing protein